MAGVASPGLGRSPPFCPRWGGAGSDNNSFAGRPGAGAEACTPAGWTSRGDAALAECCGALGGPRQGPAGGLRSLGVDATPKLGRLGGPRPAQAGRERVPTISPPTRPAETSLDEALELAPLAPLAHSPARLCVACARGVAEHAKWHQVRPGAARRLCPEHSLFNQPSKQRPAQTGAGRGATRTPWLAARDGLPRGSVGASLLRPRAAACRPLSEPWDGILSRMTGRGQARGGAG